MARKISETSRARLRMEVIWTTPARLQLAVAMDYLSERDPLAAINLDEKVDKTV